MDILSPASLLSPSSATEKGSSSFTLHASLLRSASVTSIHPVMNCPMCVGPGRSGKAQSRNGLTDIWCFLAGMRWLSLRGPGLPTFRESRCCSACRALEVWPGHACGLANRKGAESACLCSSHDSECSLRANTISSRLCCRSRP